MHVFAAVPCYDGKVHAATMDAFLGEAVLATTAGSALQVARLEGCSMIPSARNRLAMDFLESKADRLVFVDSDIAWKPGDLMKMASMPHDIIGGAYRYKRDEPGYVVRWDETVPDLWADKHGALTVLGLGMGFCAISRNALERIQEKYSERFYQDRERKLFAFFDMPFTEGTMWGEDMRFCEMARMAGVPVHAMPELELSHCAGPNIAFTGRLGDWLRGRMKQEEAA